MHSHPGGLFALQKNSTKIPIKKYHTYKCSILCLFYRCFFYPYSILFLPRPPLHPFHIGIFRLFPVTSADIHRFSIFQQQFLSRAFLHTRKIDQKAGMASSSFRLAFTPPWHWRTTLLFCFRSCSIAFSSTPGSFSSNFSFTI